MEKVKRECPECGAKVNGTPEQFAKPVRCPGCGKHGLFKETKASDGEKIFYQGNLPLKTFVASHGLLYLLLFGWNIGLLIDWIKSISCKVLLSAERVVFVEGLISQKEEDIPLYRVTDISYSQSILGRILGVGVISVASGDTSAPSFCFPFVDPKKYKELLRESALAERKKHRSVNLD